MRNVLLALGAYYACRWLNIALSAALATLTHALSPDDYTVHTLLGALTASAPDALSAALCGALVALLADSPTAAKWAILPAALFFLTALQEALANAPNWTTLATQSLTATLPPILCLATARIALRHRA